MQTKIQLISGLGATTFALTMGLAGFVRGSPNQRFWMWSRVGAQGITGGSGGGSSLLGQEQGASLAVGTPEFEHCVGLISQSMELPVSSYEFTCGKLGCMRPKSTHALKDR